MKQYSLWFDHGRTCVSFLYINLNGEHSMDPVGAVIFSGSPKFSSGFTRFQMQFGWILDSFWMHNERRDIEKEFLMRLEWILHLLQIHFRQLLPSMEDAYRVSSIFILHVLRMTNRSTSRCISNGSWVDPNYTTNSLSILQKTKLYQWFSPYQKSSFVNHSKLEED